MKIGLVCPYNIFKSGGVQECVLALQAQYIKFGHSAHIITPQPKQSNGKSYQNVILVGQARDVKSPFHTTAQISVSFDNKQIDRILDDYRFDILHFHEPWVPIISRQILMRSHATNIATFHAKLPETVMSKTIEKVITPYTTSILKYIDGYSAVSHVAAEYISSLTDQKITIIPNGINANVFRSPPLAVRRDDTILFIGRLEKRKGVKYLLNAYKQLTNQCPNVRLQIAGDGPDRHYLEEYARLLQLSNIEFLGYIDDAQKIALLHQATVFCSPALFGESFGIVLLEAMASGAVIVAGDNPGYASVLQDTGALSLVNVKDKQQFARRLDLLLHNQQLRNVWLSWAKQHIKQFSYDLIARQYLQLYKQALHKK